MHFPIRLDQYIGKMQKLSKKECPRVVVGPFSFITNSCIYQIHVHQIKVPEKMLMLAFGFPIFPVYSSPGKSILSSPGTGNSREFREFSEKAKYLKKNNKKSCENRATSPYISAILILQNKLLWQTNKSQYMMEFLLQNKLSTVSRHLCGPYPGRGQGDMQYAYWHWDVLHNRCNHIMPIMGIVCCSLDW